MQLDRVTMTGPDDSVTIDQCHEVTAEFPFVEWGILVSASNEGSNRFPSRKWINTITDGMPGFSMHLCGRWVRDLLIGKITFPREYLGKFRRIQLNFHDERTPCNPKEFAKALASLGDKQFIFQIDQTAGNRHMVAAMQEDVDLDICPLFDVSGGAGVVPESWPKPFPECHYHGYAGGLGPKNLAHQLGKIANAAGDSPIWIDMETRVRSDNDRLFDFAKVRECLQIAKPHIVTEPSHV